MASPGLADDIRSAGTMPVIKAVSKVTTNVNTETAVRVGMGDGEIAGNRIHLPLGLLERHSRTQSRDDVEIAVVAPGRITNFGHPEIDGVVDTADTEVVIGAERREVHISR